MNERLTRMTKLTKLIVLAPLAILGILIFTAIGGGLVMLLWNWLAPALFGLRLITFWQAIGLLALCRILFGGFGLGSGGERQCGLRMGGGASRGKGRRKNRARGKENGRGGGTNV